MDANNYNNNKHNNYNNNMETKLLPALIIFLQLVVVQGKDMALKINILT